MKAFPLLLCLLLTPSALAQEGKLVIAETTHAFGTIEESEQVRHTFAFRNEGDAPLRLTRVLPSCGCTTPTWTKEPIAPGDSGALHVVFDPAGRHGPFRKLIAVTTDGTPGVVRLYITGTVVPVRLEGGVRQGHLLIERPVADLGPVEASHPATHAFRVQNTGKRPIAFGVLTPSAPNVRVDGPDQPLFANDVGTFQVTVDPEGLPPGSAFDYTVALETDDAEQPEKTLRLTGTVVDAAQ